MKFPAEFALLALLASLGCACSKKGEEAGAPAPAPSALDELEVPSAEQAEREAAQRIDASNADEEFEKLKREIDADG